MNTKFNQTYTSSRGIITDDAKRMELIKQRIAMLINAQVSLKK